MRQDSSAPPTTGCDTHHMAKDQPVDTPAVWQHSEPGVIGLPDDIRKAADIGDGDVLEVTADKDGIAIRRQTSQDVHQRLGTRPATPEEFEQFVAEHGALPPDGEG